MAPTQLGKTGVSISVHVLEEFHGLVEPTCPKIDCEHRLNTHASTPCEKLIGPNGVGFNRPPRKIKVPRSLLERSDAILPTVVRDEISAGIAQICNS